MDTSSNFRSHILLKMIGLESGHLNLTMIELKMTDQ